MDMSMFIAPTTRPPKIILTGIQGSGKTTLATLFPNPVIIRVEDGTASVPGVPAGPPVKTIDDVFDQITFLATNEHDFNTLIIDSVSAFDSLAVAHIQKKNNTNNLAKAEGGFGGGYEAVRSIHMKLKEYCDRIAAKCEMTIIYIAHIDVSEESPPDTEAYTKYTIQCTKTKRLDCSEVYTKDADIIAFIKQDSYIKKGEGNDKSRAFGTNDRIVMCGLSPAHVSKNRFGIVDPIQFKKDENPLLKLIPYFNNK